MAEKVTLMILKVDLECSCCYKKIKKILCKFPEIRDQVYDEKQNLVKITVVCCCPEKIRDKLCCKGGKIIKSIEIVKPQPPKPKEPEKKEPEKKEPEKKPKEPKVVVVDKPPEPEKSKPSPDLKPDAPKKPDTQKPSEPTPKPAVVPAEPCRPCPPGVPLGYCCVPCWEGYGWERCYCGYGRPLPPPPPCYDNYGYGKPCYASRCDYYSEENAGGCTIM